MRKIILASFLVFIVILFSFFYFEAPLNFLRPALHKDIINKYAAEYKVDPLLITAMIKAESNFVKHAKSEKGAIGLMQLMPSTARDLAQQLHIGDVDEKDLIRPDLNIRLGTFYMSQLLTEFKGSVALALAAYNAGENKVELWYKENPLLENELKDIPYKETREYVKSVMETYRWMTEARQLKKLIKGKKTT